MKARAYAAIALLGLLVVPSLFASDARARAGALAASLERWRCWPEGIG